MSIRETYKLGIDIVTPEPLAGAGGDLLNDNWKAIADKLEDHDDEISDAQADATAAASDLATHAANVTDAHDLTTRLAAKAAASDLTTHENLTTSAHGGIARSARAINTTAPLSGGGDLTADRTLTISAASTSLPGSMSAADKLKLDGVATGATANTGTVTSVGLSVPNIFNVSNSPVTSANTLTMGLQTQAANLVWAGPTSGSSAGPAFRSIVPADLPAATTSAAGSLSAADKVKLNRMTTVTALNLADSGTVTPDLSLALTFYITNGGVGTINNPTGGQNGDRIVFKILNNGDEANFPILDTKFVVADDVEITDIAELGAGEAVVGILYDSGTDKFKIIAYTNGTLG